MTATGTTGTTSDSWGRWGEDDQQAWYRRPRGRDAGIGFDAAEWYKVLLMRHGIYLLEFLDLAPPARDECWEGLLTVAPLKVTGATGSPINPILIG